EAAASTRPRGARSSYAAGPPCPPPVPSAVLLRGGSATSRASASRPDVTSAGSRTSPPPAAARARSATSRSSAARSVRWCRWPSNGGGGSPRAITWTLSTPSERSCSTRRGRPGDGPAANSSAVRAAGGSAAEVADERVPAGADVCDLILACLPQGGRCVAAAPSFILDQVEDGAPEAGDVAVRHEQAVDAVVDDLARPARTVEAYDRQAAAHRLEDHHPEALV